MVKSEGVLITKENAEYTVPYEPSEEMEFYYIALLPNDSVSVCFSDELIYKVCTWLSH